MQVRIRFSPTPVIRSQSLALAVASLLTPCALLAFTLTFWSIAADLRWTSAFFVPSGLFSHWQVWLASAGLLLLLARVLSQWQSTDEDSDFHKP